MSASSGSHLSREFFELVKAIGECRSKQEEDAIIERECTILRERFADPSSSPKKIREYLLRAVYVEMLGHDASGFAYIHAVNLSSQAKSLTAKRIGYLVCCLFLDPRSSELMLLLINTIQKDLRSSNLLEVSFGLTVISKLANTDMVPVLSQLVVPLLSHSSEQVRRRAMLAVHRLIQVGSADAIEDVQTIIRRALADVDPGVMAVAIHPLFELSSEDPDSWRDLVPSVVGILGQILGHKLPPDFEYHRMPAPWIQMKLLAILGNLGEGHPMASGLMYEVIGEAMRRADTLTNAGAAIVHQAIQTAAQICPNHLLLEQASLMIAKFISSESSNLKFLGVTGLARIVSATGNPMYATEHQMKVVECLEDGDDTLKRSTLDLLFHMSNPSNVTVVVDKILGVLAQDPAHKRDLVEKVCSLAERFAPNPAWYLDTIVRAFEASGEHDLVPSSVSDNLARLIAEEDGMSGGADLRVLAANRFVPLLESARSQSGQRLAVWVAGEFGSMCSLPGYEKLEDVIDLLVDGLKRVRKEVGESAGTVEGLESLLLGYVTALAKLGGGHELIGEMTTDFDTPRLVRQRCAELASLDAKSRPAVLPFDAFCEDLDLDFSCMHAFVADAKKSGAKPLPRPIGEIRQPTQPTPRVLGGLKFDAYAPPVLAPVAPVISAPTVATAVVPTPQPGLPIVTKRWGKKQETTSVVAPTQPTVPHQKMSVPAQSAPAKATPVIDKAYLAKQRVAAALFSGVPLDRVERSPVPPKAQEPNLLDLDADLVGFTEDRVIPSQKPAADQSMNDLLGLDEL